MTTASDPVRRGPFVPYPKSAPPSRNACTDPCDMLVGPCACGATHALADWNDAVLAAHAAERGPGP